jgi:hypothetical protein
LIGDWIPIDRPSQPGLSFRVSFVMRGLVETIRSRGSTKKVIERDGAMTYDEQRLRGGGMWEGVPKGPQREGVTSVTGRRCSGSFLD